MNEDDLPHLHNLAYGGMLRQATPDDVAERLMATGHVRITTAGTLVPTEIGYKKLGKLSNFIEMGKK